jgi:hypothetical protein
MRADVIVKDLALGQLGKVVGSIVVGAGALGVGPAGEGQTD